MIKCHLSRLLGEKRMHLRELARRSGISYYSLWTLYHEKTKAIGFKTIDQICRVLGCQVGELFEYTPKQPEPFEGKKR